MDEHVLAAMDKWPDVPDVYGWLSLTRQGQWRLHPDGLGDRPEGKDAASYPAGQPISNAQILGYIHRNYSHDDAGRWFFQNGPQRVFIRLDAAPFILHTQGTGHDIRLVTHNERVVTQVTGWTLDDDGRLFAATEHGAGLISSRDLETVLGLLSCAGQPLADLLTDAMPHDAEAGSSDPQSGPVESASQAGWRSAIEFKALPNGAPARLRYCRAIDVPATLGFVANPQATRTEK